MLSLFALAAIIGFLFLRAAFGPQKNFARLSLGCLSAGFALTLLHPWEQASGTSAIVTLGCVVMAAGLTCAVWMMLCLNVYEFKQMRERMRQAKRRR